MTVEDGLYTGICMDIWKLVSNDLNLSYEVKAVRTWNKLSWRMANGKADVGMQALIWSPERNDIDFTPPFQVPTHSKKLGSIDLSTPSLIPTPFLLF